MTLKRRDLLGRTSALTALAIMGVTPASAQINTRPMTLLRAPRLQPGHTDADAGTIRFLESAVA